MERVERTLIMDPEKVEQKLQRIARQILEKHFEEEDLLVIGIQEDGERIASRCREILEGLAGSRPEEASITMNKKAPLSKDPELSVPLEALEGRTVILVDDVVNSGRTLAYAAQHLLQVPLNSLTTVALVDREHHRFPIRADLVGTTLATTMKQHIEVAPEDGGEHVYLK